MRLPSPAPAAAAVVAAAAPENIFWVTNFTAAAVPHSTIASYNFQLSLGPEVIATACGAQPWAAEAALVSVDRTRCSDDAGQYSWAWQFPAAADDDDGAPSSAPPAGGGIGGEPPDSSTLFFYFTYPGCSRTVRGSRAVPADQVVWGGGGEEGGGTGAAQRYVGPADFDVPYADWEVEPGGCGG
ncbi:hypothetical protein GGR56DRAFT_668653 [Xylariaceae sp. FL0804]|nr:hypothetical protein GGR56DRAFT_668653 [Xylariaceae sp. FL0804]